jgi:hypothetical protein
MKKTKTSYEIWAARWLDPVASGASTMSQRKLKSVKRYGGGLPIMRKLATVRGVHLLLIKDEKGNEVLAASQNPFKVIC